jgi:hypothetical protein
MGDKKPGTFGGGGTFEVSCEATAPAEPCKGALDNPALGQELEAFDPARSLDNLDCPRPAMGECVDELFATVNPVGKDMPKSGKALSQAFQQGDSSVDVLDVGRMNVDSQQQTVGIGDNVPLAPIKAFARVKSTWPTGLRRRSRLAVDNGSRRLRFVPEFPPRLPDQGADDPVPPASVAPGIK